ncbi:nucleotidyltransferase family protein [Prevotella sp. AGR2160]|uniref:nucleotidyltransferase domain-containing protein n=1 Tax=Prevotella sp. AGR2160 TaxID=1280674 RepID=UPI00040B7E92|nr:nucleotidyltransferase family protein [Prevotella sp. AGR2160]
MSKEKATEKLMLALLRHALFGMPVEACRLSDDEYRVLMMLARRQTVQGLVGSALMDAGFTLSHASAMDLLMETERVKRANGQVSGGLQKMAQLLQRSHLSFVIVKGQMVGALYPHPERRCPGDVDLYLPGDHYGRAKSLVEKMTGKDLDAVDEGKHVEVMIDGVDFEFHHTLAQLYRPAHQQWFNKRIDDAIAARTDEAVILGTAVPTLAPTENLLFVFMHFFFHLAFTGCGLRQFCDVAVLMHRKGNEIDRKRFEEDLRRLGLQKAFRAMAAFLVTYLGLPEADVPVTLGEADYRWTEPIRQNVMAGGNFGRSHRHVRQSGLLHSLDSAWLDLRQTLTYARLAPQEVLGRFWSLTVLRSNLFQNMFKKQPSKKYKE